MAVRCAVVIFSLWVALGLVRVEAQQPVKDAAHWQAYVAALPLNSGVVVKTKGGGSLKGPLVATTADDMVIHAQRSLRRDVDVHVRYDTIQDVSKENRLKRAVIGGIVGGVAAIGVVLLVTAVLGCGC